LPVLSEILSRSDLPPPLAYMARNNRAVLYMHEGNYEAAIQDLDMALAQSPGNAQLLTVRGDAELHVADRDKAMDDYNKAIETSGVHGYPHFRRGDLLFREGRYREALDEYNGLRSAKENWVGLYILCAVAEQRLGRTKAMQADLNRAEDIAGPKARNDFTTISDQTAQQAKPQTAVAETATALPAADARDITPPSALSYHAAIGYPPMSRYMNDEGAVVVTFIIGKDGRVRDPRIAKSSGFEDMDQMALASVGTWLYRPAEKDGASIEVRTKAHLEFNLDNDAPKVAKLP
jgi:protein TonB